MLTHPESTQTTASEQLIEPAEHQPLVTMPFLNLVADILHEHQATEQTVQGLKAQFPAIRFLLCSEDDMAEREPFLAFEQFGFYLMAASLGCACLTNDLEKSAGIIIATLES